jgi:hypothetical protein
MHYDACSFQDRYWLESGNFQKENTGSLATIMREHVHGRSLNADQQRPTSLHPFKAYTSGDYYMLI